MLKLVSQIHVSLERKHIIVTLGELKQSGGVEKLVGILELLMQALDYITFLYTSCPSFFLQLSSSPAS